MFHSADLQKSRKVKTPKANRSSSVEPHSNHHVAYSISKPVPFSHSTPDSTASLLPPKRYARTMSIHRSLEKLQQLNKEREAGKERSSLSVCMHRGPGSMPCVADLRNYFEALTVKNADEREKSRSSSVSPRTSPKHSPTMRRKNREIGSEHRRPRSSHFSLSRRLSSSSTVERVTSELRNKMNFSSRTSSSSSSSSNLVIENVADKNGE